MDRLRTCLRHAPSDEQEAVGPIGFVNGSAGFAGKIAADRHGCGNRAVNPAALFGHFSLFEGRGLGIGTIIEDSTGR